MKEQIFQWIWIGGIILSILSTILTVAIKFCKNGKLKKALERTQEVFNVIESFVIDAEKMNFPTGEMKKTYVLSLVENFCLRNNIDFDAGQISAVIENLITLSKNVNSRKKLDISTLVEKKDNTQSSQSALSELYERRKTVEINKAKGVEENGRRNEESLGADGNNYCSIGGDCYGTKNCSNSDCEYFRRADENDGE